MSFRTCQAMIIIHSRKTVPMMAKLNAALQDAPTATKTKSNGQRLLSFLATRSNCSGGVPNEKD